MDVVDPIGEKPDKLARIHPLPMKLARIQQEAELLAPSNRFESHFSSVQVKGDLAWRDGGGELDAAIAIDVQDGVPPSNKCSQARRDYLRRRRIGTTGV